LDREDSSEKGQGEHSVVTAQCAVDSLLKPVLEGIYESVHPARRITSTIPDDAMLALAFSRTLFSIKVAVGQACTQAPQDTHSELRKSMPPEKPWNRIRGLDGQREGALTSSHARTQREHTMHLAAQN